MESGIVAFFVALSFLLWPIVGQYAGVSSAWVSSVVMGSTAIVIVGFSLYTNSLKQLPSTKALAILFVAGIINGLGVYVYAYMAVRRDIQIGIFVAGVSICMIILSPVIAAIIEGEMLSGRQIIGIILGVGAVYMLNTS